MTKPNKIDKVSEAITNFTVKSRKGHRAREAILDAAIRLIAAEGIAGLNVSRITAEANIGRASFYNYFEAADDVVLQLLLRVQTQIEQALDQVHGQHERGAKRFRVCLDELQKRLLADPDFARLSSELMLHSDVARKAFYTAVRPEIEAAISNGDCGLILKEVDAFLELMRLALFSADASTSTRAQKVDILLRASDMAL